jgi:hypothetical protein
VCSSSGSLIRLYYILWNFKDQHKIYLFFPCSKCHVCDIYVLKVRDCNSLKCRCHSHHHFTVFVSNIWKYNVLKMCVSHPLAASLCRSLYHTLVALSRYTVFFDVILRFILGSFQALPIDWYQTLQYITRCVYFYNIIQNWPRKSSPPPVCTCSCDILSLALVIFSLALVYCVEWLNS